MGESLVPGLTAAPPRTRRLGFELAIVFVLACALLVPGIWRGGLIDPWETHYGEVGRRMLQDKDWVRTQWSTENFRSKPVLTFWLMAASLKATGHTSERDPGGYSGEMADSRSILLAIRLPFTLLAVMGLTLMWLMVARLWSRRAAWLAFLVLGTTPFYFMIARQAITDMTMVALILGAISMFVLAAEDGEDQVRPFLRIPIPRWRGKYVEVDIRWVFAAIIGGFIMVQAAYYLNHFESGRHIRVRGIWLSRVNGLGWWFFILMSLGTLYVIWPRLFTHLKALPIWAVLALTTEDKDGRTLPRAMAMAEPSLLAWPLWPLFAIYTWANARPDPWGDALVMARHATRVEPLRRSGQVYILWFWSFVGISVLGKGIPGFGLAGLCAASYVIFFHRWKDLWNGMFEVKRGVVLLLLTILPWHLAMWVRDGQKFIQDWVFMHNLNRAAVGVHGDRGTFDYCVSQVGYGMFIWVALLPAALAAAAMVPAPSTRAARMRFMVAAWAILATALFSLSQTKFHHYIFPAVPAFAILVGLWLDDLLAGRVKPSLVLGAFGAGVVLLLARDLMHEEALWVEMHIYRYDRAWPSALPWGIDASDAFLVMGLAGAAASVLIGTPLRRLAVLSISTVALGTALWGMHVYQPIATTHWGCRDAARKYYQERQIYGQKLTYFTPRQFHDDWSGVKDHWDFDTFIPDAFQDGQPMTITIEVQGTQQPLAYKLVGRARTIGDHTLRIDLDPAAVTPVRDSARRFAKGKLSRKDPSRVVDADRLIGWQMYWRGEQFWSGDELWSQLNNDSTNAKFNQYMADRVQAPEGRRYFVLTEANRTGSLRSLLPTETARETVQVIDTTGNKFALMVFQM